MKKIVIFESRELEYWEARKEIEIPDDELKDLSETAIRDKFEGLACNLTEERDNLEWEFNDMDSEFDMTWEIEDIQ